MTWKLKKRFLDNLQFLASYTWSHSLYDSSDLKLCSSAGQSKTSG